MLHYLWGSLILLFSDKINKGQLIQLTPNSHDTRACLLINFDPFLSVKWHMFSLAKFVFVIERFSCVF